MATNLPENFVTEQFKTGDKLSYPRALKNHPEVQERRTAIKSRLFEEMFDVLSLRRAEGGGKHGCHYIVDPQGELPAPAPQRVYSRLVRGGPLYEGYLGDLGDR